MRIIIEFEDGTRTVQELGGMRPSGPLAPATQGTDAGAAPAIGAAPETAITSVSEPGAGPAAGGETAGAAPPSDLTMGG